MAGEKKQVELVTWYFEMFAAPEKAPRACPDGVEVKQIKSMPVHFYRYIYDIVGSPWVWWERKGQTDERIREDIHHPEYDVFVPYWEGVPAGLIELDWRVPGDVQLNYFGVVPDFVGRGLGGYLLDWTVREVFARGAKRYWVHTCSLDSPAAVPCYESAGFVQFKEERSMMDDPKAVAE